MLRLLEIHLGKSSNQVKLRNLIFPGVIFDEFVSHKQKIKDFLSQKKPAEIEETSNFEDLCCAVPLLLCNE